MSLNSEIKEYLAIGAGILLTLAVLLGAVVGIYALYMIGFTESNPFQ